MTAKEKILRDASEIWLATNMSLTLLKQRVFLLFWVYNAAPLQPELTLRHTKQTGRHSFGILEQVTTLGVCV